MANASTASGREPVDVQTWVRAAGEGDEAQIEFLLAAGANVNAALESGETALIRATSKGRLGVVRRLLEAGADPNAEREDGFTALGVAVFFGYADIVRALLAGGADPTAKGRLGTTAEKWALVSGYGEIVELLRSHRGSGPPSSEGDGRDSGAAGPPALFPFEGAFRPVVPLSKLDESAGAEGARASGSPAGTAAEAAGRKLARDDEEEAKEQEVLTVVRPRAARAPTPLPARPAHPRLERPKSHRQPWTLTLVLLGLSLIAGLSAGTYLLGAWRTVERPQPAAPEAAAETGIRPPAPQTATDTSATQPHASTPPLPEPSQPAATAEAATAEAPSAPSVAPAVEDDPKTAKKNADRPTPAPTPQLASLESRRADRAEPAARSESGAAARAARPSSTTAEAKGGDAKTRDARREAANDGRRAQRTERRVTTASPRQTPPPVLSPAPSAKSRKVIPWP